MTIIITDEDVKRLLTMRDCIEAMRVAFGDLADGAAVRPSPWGTFTSYSLPASWRTPEWVNFCRQA
jgi:hypothetical protein